MGDSSGSLRTMVPELILLPSQTTTIQLVTAQTGGKPKYATTVELGWTRHNLVARFECQDPYVWGTMTERDDPIYQEEVVEIFISPGAADPKRYFEFELNPDGVLWDGIIDIPTGTRQGMVSDPTWNSESLTWSAWRDDDKNRWGAEFNLDLTELAPEGIPTEWRINFFRIERPETGGVEYSCWSPTLVSPADFHVPSRMGLIKLPGIR